MDMFGHTITKTRTDVDQEGNPLINVWGYAVVEYVRDSNGTVVEERFFNTEGERVEGP